MKTEKQSNGYFCSIGKELIAKYRLDLKCCEIKADGEYKLICDHCAKKIALYIIDEF